MTTSVLVVAGLLLLFSVIASKAARVGVPALLIFLSIGMLAGSDGPGGIPFDNPPLAQGLGVVALVLILFAGGLDTEWTQVRPVLREGVILATLGTFATATLTGAFAAMALGVTWTEGALLGAIVSSTDAAAVFSSLRSRGIGLARHLRSLLELESGSNDPMAVFLTIGMVQLLVNPETTPAWLAWLFARQMTLGAVGGYVMGRVSSVAINRLRLEYEGLYPVLSLSLVLVTYGLIDWLGGSGFLAAYVAGIVLRRSDFIHKRSLIRFHDGVSWLMQITMFTVLGLQVFPSSLPRVAGAGLAVSLCLMFVARPAAVLLSLGASRLRWRERLLVAWVGLRGAAPIILATFPLVYGIPRASSLFDIVFFIVLTSTLIQGTTMGWVGRRLGLARPLRESVPDPLDVMATGGRELMNVTVAAQSAAAGRRLMDLNLPVGALVVLVERHGQSWIPSGGTELQPHDRLVILSGPDERDLVRRLVEDQHPNTYTSTLQSAVRGDPD